MRAPLPILALLALSACAGTSDSADLAVVPSNVATAPRTIDISPAKRGEAYARTHCAACHAVAPGELSPFEAAPSFVHVGNTQGLTLDTLSVWLRNSHNYPEVMNFQVEDNEIDDLAAYILTLQRPDYVPPIQR